jgi:hypothetical protein
MFVTIVLKFIYYIFYYLGKCYEYFYLFGLYSLLYIQVILLLSCMKIIKIHCMLINKPTPLTLIFWKSNKGFTFLGLKMCACVHSHSFQILLWYIIQFYLWYMFPRTCFWKAKSIQINFNHYERTWKYLYKHKFYRKGHWVSIVEGWTKDTPYSTQEINKETILIANVTVSTLVL